jgi:hypothetical protein
MKKYFIIAALLATTVAQAAQVTTTITAGACSNLLSSFSGSAKVTDILITTPASTATTLKIVDSPTATNSYVSPAYTGVTSYSTNVITTYTNFFGVVNNITNIQLVDITNTVSAVTNSYPIRFQAYVGTNTSQLYSGVDYMFLNGLWATNVTSGAGSTTVTITYQQ